MKFSFTKFLEDQGFKSSNNMTYNRDDLIISVFTSTIDVRYMGINNKPMGENLSIPDTQAKAEYLFELFKIPLK